MEKRKYLITLWSPHYGHLAFDMWAYTREEVEEYAKSRMKAMNALKYTIEELPTPRS